MRHGRIDLALPVFSIPPPFQREAQGRGQIVPFPVKASARGVSHPPGGFLRCRATVGLLQHFARVDARHQELLRRGVVWQECNLAAVADAEEPYSFFTCKITC
jgi:hypothetical protein